MASLWELDDMYSQIFLFTLSPQSIFLSTLTYLRPDSSDRRPASFVCPGGGGLVLFPLNPHAPMIPLFVPSCLPPTWLPLLAPHPAPLPWFCPSDFCLVLLFLLLSQCPPYDTQFPSLLNFLFFDGSRTTLQTPMLRNISSQICSCTGTCERVQDLMKSPFGWKQKQISLPYFAKGQWISAFASIQREIS